MDSYLMMLYVTLEQESALKNFFVEHGWKFSKPDLSVITDQIGPSVQNSVTIAQSLDTTNSPIEKGKRKAKPSQKGPVIKIAKIVPSKEKAIVNSKHTLEEREADKETLEEVKDTVSTSTAHVNTDHIDQEETLDFSYNSEKYEDNDTDTGDYFEGNAFYEDTDVEYDVGEGYKDADVNSDESRTEKPSTEITLKKGQNYVDSEEETKANEHRESKNVKGARYGARHHHSYTQDQIDSALLFYNEHQNSGEKISIRKLAGMFSVPLTTLFHHIRSASGKSQRTIICEICGQSFVYQHQLKQHIEQQHKGRKTTYKCHLCTKKFQFKSRLQYHMNMHNNDRPYVCKNKCGKSYFSPQSRYSHELQCQSNNPRPFQCINCGLDFKVQSALNRHVMAKHGAPQYFCDCGQAFGWSQSFNRHRKTCKK